MSTGKKKLHVIGRNISGRRHEAVIDIWGQTANLESEQKCKQPLIIHHLIPLLHFLPICRRNFGHVTLFWRHVFEFSFNKLLVNTCHFHIFIFASTNYNNMIDRVGVWAEGPTDQHKKFIYVSREYILIHRVRKFENIRNSRQSVLNFWLKLYRLGLPISLITAYI